MMILDILKKNENEFSKRKLFLGFMGILFLALVTYRTLFPIPPQYKHMDQVFYTQEEAVCENDNISLSIDLNGALVTKIFLKKYNHAFCLNSPEHDPNNFFESGWSSNIDNIPSKNTQWYIKDYTKDKVVLTTTIRDCKFTKIFSLGENTLHIEDIVETPKNYEFNNIYNYGLFSVDKNNTKPINFISYKDKPSQIYREDNKNISVNKTQKISNEGGFGIENKSFICFCTTSDGNVFIRNHPTNSNCNEIFALSNRQNTRSQKYTLYIMPKDEKLLQLYNLNHIIEYGWFSFMVKPLSRLLTYLIVQTNSGIISLLILTILILLINLPLVYLLEKEKVKLIIHEEEKRYIEENYRENTDTRLKEFYDKHNIKMLRIFFLPIILYLSWFCLNKAINLCFTLRGTEFLWLKDLSSKDPLSVLNLYGLLHINLNYKILSYISTDVLSIVAVLLFNNHNSTLQNKSSQKNVPVVMRIMHLLGNAVLLNSISSGFAIAFICILFINYMGSVLISRYLLSKYSL